MIRSLTPKQIFEECAHYACSEAFIAKMNHPTAKEILLELWRHHEKTRPAILETLERVEHEKKFPG